jgi:DNA-directed RNA polymerase specialized sigma24 family protein
LKVARADPTEGRQHGDTLVKEPYEPAVEGGSVTLWIGHLKGGDDQAAYHLWERYFPRLVGLARSKLGQAPKGVADEEDAALSAFYALCQGAASGQFDRLHDRDDLWRLLVVITARKAVDLKKHRTRQKRGGGNVITESILGDADRAGAVAVIEQVVDTDPTPEIAAMLAEEYRRRLDALGDDALRRVAILRLEGYDRDEIAVRLGCARRTVARRLEMIRSAWGGTSSTAREAR